MFHSFTARSNNSAAIVGPAIRMRLLSSRSFAIPFSSSSPFRYCISDSNRVAVNLIPVRHIVTMPTVTDILLLAKGIFQPGNEIGGRVLILYKPLVEELVSSLLNFLSLRA